MANNPRFETALLAPLLAVSQANSFIPPKGKEPIGIIYVESDGLLKIAFKLKGTVLNAASKKFSIATDFNTFDYTNSKERTGVISSGVTYFIGVA